MIAATAKTVVTALAAVLTIAGVALLTGPGAPFAVTGRSTLAGLLFVGAGLIALAAGIGVRVLRGQWLSSVLLAALAALWFAPGWVAWYAAPAGVGAIAAGAVLLTPAVLAHVAAAFPEGTIIDHRRAIASVYAIAGVAAVLRVVAFDPFQDASCWADCRPNPFAILSVPWVSSLSSALSSASAALVVVIVLLTRARRPRYPRWPGAVALLSTGLLAIGLAVDAVGAVVHRSDPVMPMPAIALALISIALAALAFAHVAAALDASARVAKLRAITAGARAGGLEALLAAALRDPSVRIAYRVGDAYIDAAGVPIAPTAMSSDHAVTRVARGSRQVAVIHHGIDPGALEREIGPALRVALENESLRVELDATLAALRDSRSRVIAAADAHRRAIEQDLHDGAQQGLIALAWHLQAAAREAAEHGDLRCADLLEGAVDEARATLDDLRSLAHGIRPAVLTNDGVAAALRTYALSAPLAVTVVGTLPRLAAEAEAAMYFYATSAIVSLAGIGASSATIGLRVDPSSVVVSIDAGTPGSTTLASIVYDRIGALGGKVAADGSAASIPFAPGQVVGAGTDQREPAPA